MKEMKSNDVYLDSDGTLGISADVDISKVKRILLTQEGIHCGSMYSQNLPDINVGDMNDSEMPNSSEERTETHACDLISREDVEQTVEDNILCYTHSDRPIDQDPDTECHKAIRTALKMLRKDLRKLPSAQKKRYTKADYIMALHKEYGCSLTKAEEAHNKALEYLRDNAMMKG